MEARVARALAELRAERAELTSKLARIDEAIASTERAAGIIPTGAAATPPQSTRRGPRAAFIPAVLELLRKDEGRALTTQQVVDELRSAGFKMDVKDPYRNAAALLRREAARPDARVFKIDDSWFPASLSA